MAKAKKKKRTSRNDTQKLQAIITAGSDAVFRLDSGRAAISLKVTADSLADVFGETIPETLDLDGVRSDLSINENAAVVSVRPRDYQQLKTIYKNR